MILVTRLDGKEMVVNAEHILTVERTPDTVILLSTGLRLMVREPIEEISERAIAYRRRTLSGPELRAAVLPFHRGAPKNEED
jgi:flagellar protein FlbD